MFCFLKEGYSCVLRVVDRWGWVVFLIIFGCCTYFLFVCRWLVGWLCLCCGLCGWSLLVFVLGGCFGGVSGWVCGGWVWVLCLRLLCLGVFCSFVGVRFFWLICG